MRIFHCDAFGFPLPASHRFPLEKFRLLRERIEAAGLVPPGELVVPAAATEAELLRAHEADYVRRALAGLLTEAEVRRIGFPWSPELIERSRRSVGATLGAARAALANGAAASLAGGTHHAGWAFGEGYCLFNDSIIAIRALQAEGKVRRAVVLDCDVHQGNGTAEIAAADASIFTFSIHAARNFPARKFPSDLDVDLPDGAGDAEYLSSLQMGLQCAISRAQADFALFIAGADPFEGDRLGRLNVSKAGLAERDRLVFDAVQRAGLPVAITMGGGYAHEVRDTVDIQFATIAEAVKRWR